MTDAPQRIKRFYKTVSLEAVEDGHGVLLDGRRALTKARRPLVAPAADLGAAVAAEWEAQGEHIDRETMPLTALLSAAIDYGEEDAEANRTEVLNYLRSDLLCYRAAAPQALAERQAIMWDPYLDWLRAEFGARLIVTEGVSAVDQPENAVAAVGGVLEEMSAHHLIALKGATAISGSAILALALWKSASPAEDIFEASLVDERFQQERWGVDAEAEAREQGMRREFLQIAEFLRLSREN